VLVELDTCGQAAFPIPASVNCNAARNILVVHVTRIYVGFRVTTAAGKLVEIHVVVAGELVGGAILAHIKLRPALFMRDFVTLRLVARFTIPRI
jgi:hypothetical protein